MYGALNLSVATLVALIIVAPVTLMLAREAYALAPSLVIRRQHPLQQHIYKEAGLAGISPGGYTVSRGWVYTILGLAIALHVVGFTATILLLVTAWTSLDWALIESELIAALLIVASLVALLGPQSTKS